MIKSIEEAILSRALSPEIGSLLNECLKEEISISRGTIRESMIKMVEKRLD